MWKREESRAVTREPQSPVVREAAKLGSSVFVRGELAGSEDVTVDGRVEGRIDLPDHALTIGPNANIQADIVAKVVTVFGAVVGGVTAREKVDIRLGGSLKGHVVCACIAMQEGAHLSGRVQMPSPVRKQALKQTETAIPVVAAAV